MASVEDKRLVTSKAWERPFPVNGQGTLIFNTDRHKKPFYISVEDEDGTIQSNWIALHIGVNYAEFLMHRKGNKKPKRLIKIPDPRCGVEDGGVEDGGVEDGKVSYWYSYDRDNLVLKYGKGYRMEETTLMMYDFLIGQKKPDKVRQDMHPFFNAEGKKFIRQYDEKPLLQFDVGGIEVTEPLVEFDKQPLICNIPPLVLDSSKVNLFILDRGNFVFSASLPAACRELYANIAGCDLNYTEEKDEKVLLSDAIRYSLENGILKKKLDEKSSDGAFGYLRVTLGHSLGKSPGIPYVLEIWPAGHSSPIHNHGNANAVIKVLFGSIHVDVYNKQKQSHDDPKPKKQNFEKREEDPKPLKSSFEARVGDVTWINRNWYQTHQLRNASDDYCATIQCYNYDSGDNTHWPYFDYLSDNKTIEEFLPDSDFGFLDMREKVMAEYHARKSCDN